jgi:hypothetical protein
VTAMGTVRDRPGLSPPCQQAWGLLPRGSPCTLRARLSDTKNRKPSRTSERPQRRADGVRGHRDRQDQSRKRAEHTRHDNDLMSAPRPAPRRSPGIRTDPRPLGHRIAGHPVQHHSQNRRYTRQTPVHGPRLAKGDNAAPQKMMAAPEQAGKALMPRRVHGRTPGMPRYRRCPWPVSGSGPREVARVPGRPGSRQAARSWERHARAIGCSSVRRDVGGRRCPERARPVPASR